MATVMERRIRGRERQEIADELSRRVDGEVRFDPHSRLLYSTDASIYQMEPVGVVIPRSSADVQAVVEFAAREGIPVLPRSGGTSLAGQTVNHAIVMDFSKYLNNVLEVNAEEQWARVQPGIILDQLTRQMGPHGLQYAPDPTTANRACVGGGIGNNTCGAHSVIYGKTLDHIQELDVILSDGSTARFGELSPPSWSPGSAPRAWRATSIAASCASPASRRTRSTAPTPRSSAGSPATTWTSSSWTTPGTAAR